MGGPIGWQHGKRIHDDSATTVSIIKQQIEGIRKLGNVTAWMDMMRTARHPQQMWEVDYIRPREPMLEINDLIRQSEIILYGDYRNLTLRDGYKADIFQEVVFHTIRAHLRAEEGNFSACVEIFQELLRDWYDRVPIIRQSNLLMHCCLTFLCCKKWQESYDCLQKHWGLLKFCNPVDRDALGIWDNEIITRQIYWFFMQYSADFRYFYTSKLGVSSTVDIWNHKKIGLLHLLKKDHSWVVSFCSLPLYNHAQKLISELPVYHLTRNTPINYARLRFQKENKKVELPYSVAEKYAEEYKNSVIDDPRSVDKERQVDCLYSFFTFHRDVDRGVGAFARVWALLEEHYPRDELRLMLDAGCGLSAMECRFKERYHDNEIVYVGVDISEQVCNILKDALEFEYVHSDINRYLEHSDRFFDVILASRLLQCLPLEEARRFISLSSQRGKIIGASLETVDDIRDEMGEPINLHRTVMSAKEWIVEFEEHYNNLNYHIDNDILYICGTSKNT